MKIVELDDNTATAIQLAADTAGITPGEVVRRLVERTRAASPAGTGESPDSGTVRIHAVYEGVRTRALYDPTTHRVTITDGPLEGRSFKSPSGAAIAVVSHYQSSVNPNRNGWTFWTITDSGDLLQSIRHQR